MTSGVLMAAVAGAVLVRYLIGGGRLELRVADLLPTGAVVAGVLYVFACIDRSPLALLFALPALLAVVVMFLLTLPRLFTGRASRSGEVGLGLRRLLAALGIVALTLSVVRTAQFERRRAETAAFAAPFRAATRSFDHRGASWSQAFGALVDRLAAEYPFTAWKGIDWEELRAEFGPRIAAAESAADTRGFYKALREMAWRLPDGHVSLTGDDHGLRTAEIGGSFGLDLVELSSGRIVAQRVAPGGAAARAGMKEGAEILAWGGGPTAAAVEKASCLWTDTPPATTEGRRRWQLHFLARAAVGSSVTVIWRNPNSPEEERTLVAVEQPELPRPNRAGEIL
ncbi:MAG TPA: hypothetical protein VI589_08530, partial [Vicinamibacteria bacterium]